MTAALLTAFALIAFAANSLLCRKALGGELIDPVSFTALRLSSGALVLLAIAARVREPEASGRERGSWRSGLALFVYAAAFSLAYVSLEAGLGALLLFGAVQVTMIGAALRMRERLRLRQWIGAAGALGGLVYLVRPGGSAPDPVGAVLMVTAGAAWGVYSIRGRGAAAPVAMTAGNFLRATPMILVLVPWGLSARHAETAGVGLALVSGVITSGLGYVVWYRALRHLTTTQAAVVQLLAPVLAAFGGVILLSEAVSLRLIAAGVFILGGVALAVLRRNSTGRG